MNIGELFINLGIKGTEKTVGALTGVKDNLKDVKSSSLEAKAAILGAVYALGRLINSTGQKGNELAHFGALMDTTTKTLQQYQYAAQQVGVSNESVTGTFKALQSSMTKILLGEGIPKRLAQFGIAIGENIGPDVIEKWKKNPELLIQKMRDYFKLEKDKGLRREVATSLGFSDDMQSALAQDAFRPEVLNRAPTYNEGDIKGLQKNQAEWANLAQKVEMAFGKLNVKHGSQIIADLSKMADAFLRLAEAMIKFSDQIGLFDKIGEIMQGWTTLMSGGVTAAVEKATAEKYGDGKSFWNQLKTVGSAIMGTGDETEIPEPEVKKKAAAPSRSLKDMLMLEGVADITKPRTINPAQAIKPTNFTAPETARGMVAPQQPVTNNQGTSNVHNINVNQNLNFNGNTGENAGQVRDSMKKAVQDAYRQNPAQAQGS